MISIDEQCTGCLACMNICPRNAISVGEDNKGFIIPIVDSQKCVDCGICEQVCNMGKGVEYLNHIKKLYSLVINDKKVLFHSTSGGAFTALSDVVLQSGGAIAGAVLEKDFTVHHIIAESVQERDKLRGSKYVQSNVNHIYQEIKRMLHNKQRVMFVGTPCQAAALRSYLGRDYDNLIVIDFLCHGVPNNKLFKDHIAYMERKHSHKVVYYSFRGKRYTAAAVQFAKYDDNKIRAALQDQAYYSFFGSLSLRDSCYQCKYRSPYRAGDITIADFWGIEKITNKKHTKGISKVYINTDKGQDIFNQAIQRSSVCEYPIEAINDSSLRYSSDDRKNQRELFWKTYNEEGYSALVERFYIPSFYRKCRFALSKIVKQVRSNFDFGCEFD